MRSPLSLLVLALALIVVGAFAPAVSAETYCIGADAECSGSPANIRAATQAGLESAIDDASSNFVSDRIVIGTTIDITSSVQIYAPNSDPLHLDGVVGSGATLHFTNPVNDGLFFNALGETLSKIDDLKIKVDGATTGERTGIFMYGGKATGLQVDVTGDGNAPVAGLRLGPGTCEFCEFTVAGDKAVAVKATSPTVNIIASTFAAVGSSLDAVAIWSTSSGGNTNVKRSTFSGFERTIDVQSATVALVDSLIDLKDNADAVGVAVMNSGSTNLSLAGNLDGVTIVGTGDSQRGVHVEASTGSPLGEYATANVTNTMFMLTGNSPEEVFCWDDAGNGIGTLNLSYSLISGSTPNAALCDGSVANNVNRGVTGPDAFFLDAASGDYRLRPDAMAVDAGDPATLVSGRTFDPVGNARIVDGTESGSARIDIGGFEYGPYAPNKPSASASSLDVEVGSSIDFSASGIDGNGDTLTYAWDFDDGATADTQNATHSFATPGTYTVEVRTHDGALQSLPASIVVTVRAKPACCRVPDTTNHVTFTNASKKLKFKRHAKLKKGFKVSTKKPKGARITVAADSAVSGTLRLYNSKGKAIKGSQRATLPAGRSYLTFGGKWNGKRLRPGKYTLRFSASALNESPKSILSVIR